MPERMLAARQVRSRRWLLRAGVGSSSIHNDLTTGLLEQLAPGRYLPAATFRDADLDQQALARIAAVAARSPALAISHASAAVVHGLPTPFADLMIVHLTRNGATGARRGRERTVHVAALPDRQITEVSGLKVTTVARTLLDMACSEDRRTALAAADCALNVTKVSPTQLARMLGGCGPRSGIVRARQLLRFADGRSESAGETWLRLVMFDLGLPEPELQVEVHDAAGTFLGRVDLAYPDLAVLIEFDGFKKYKAASQADSMAVVLEEKRREARLLEAGFVVVRFIWSDLFHPDRVYARIQAALERGRRAMAAGMVTGRLTPARPVRMG